MLPYSAAIDYGAYQQSRPVVGATTTTFTHSWLVPNGEDFESSQQQPAIEPWHVWSLHSSLGKGSCMQSLFTNSLTTNKFGTNSAGNNRKGLWRWIEFDINFKVTFVLLGLSVSFASYHANQCSLNHFNIHAFGILNFPIVEAQFIAN